MLWRKAKKSIDEWIDDGKEALLVEGARQIGKSFLIEACLTESGRPFVRLDLIENDSFSKSLQKACGEGTNAILELLSLHIDPNDEGGKPIVFIDEVQKCPDFVTMIKYLVQDGRYQYILSGSLLGISLAHIRSQPVGFMSILTMYPLTFEEFGINNGFTNSAIASIHDSFEKKTPVNEYLHEKAMNLFRRYLIVGGMPEAVDAFIKAHDLKRVIAIQSFIKELYKRDFTQQTTNDPFVLEMIYDQIKDCLDSQNRRFVVAHLEKGTTTDDYQSDFYWLYKAGVVIPVYNLAAPSIPFKVSDSQKLLKLFYNDIGLLSSYYGENFIKDVLSEADEANLGGVYENFVAQELLASSQSKMPPYYFKQRKIGELDFVTSCKGETIALEIKSGNYAYNHPGLDKMLAVPNYHLKQAYVLYKGNVRPLGKITYLPIYMAGLFN